MLFINRVQLANYKSIGRCDVHLDQLTYLVGPNGSGKSNFLDALRLVSDSLNSTLDHALRERGGIKDVRRRSSGHPTHFSIKLHFTIGDEQGFYAFRVGAKPASGFEVQKEELVLKSILRENTYYKVEKGQVVDSSSNRLPAAAADRLYLVNASGLPEFRKVYEHLSQMGFYSLNPDRIRDLQSPDSGHLLLRDGSNIASVMRQIDQNLEMKTRIEEFLSRVVPGVESVSAKVVGPKETLEFRQRMQGASNSWRFFAANMSDGTLRALGVLVALFQNRSIQEQYAPLIGIEEPETALHPAASGVLRDCLNEAASTSTQVIVTSHSPDLLDDEDISDQMILGVSAELGETKIGPLDSASRSAIKERLYTPGELLRLNQLAPALTDEDSDQTGSTESLFGDS